jgi:uncharacterized YccA/Bax inhibitor family protein
MGPRTPIIRRQQIVRIVYAVLCIVAGAFAAYSAWLISNQAVRNGHPDNAWLIRACATGIVATNHGDREPGNY